jgi:outer membrane protein TolC
MRVIPRVLAAGFFTTLFLAAMAWPARATAQEPTLDPGVGMSATIAIVRDGPSPGDTLELLIQRELDALNAGLQIELTFKSLPEFDAGWQADRMQPALQAALDDPEVDFVLTTGMLITQAATQMELTKPVVSAFRQSIDLFSIADLEGDRSLKEGLTFVLIANRVEGDLASLADLEDLARVTVALPAEHAEQLTTLDAEVAALEAASGLGLDIVPLSADVAQSLSRLSPDVEAVLLASTPRYTTSQRSEFIRGLTERGVNSFSLVGHEDLEIGVLAARTPETATLVSRRAALDLSELLRGTDVNDLPVLISADPELVIEGAVGAAIGYRPSLITLAYATIRNASALALGEEPLSLREALQLAQQGNPDLAISGQDVEISRREQQLSLSPMLPQINATLDANWLSPAGLEAVIPDRLFKTGIQASQMIYDDRTVSQYRSAGRLFEARQYDYETTRLDVVESAGVAFARLGLARLLYEIELSNLRLTEENLELARFRADVGYSGRDEVFRWEAEVANRRSDLYDRLSSIDTERVALNQLLGVEQDTRWDTEEIEIDPEVFPFLDGRLPSLITNIDNLERLREVSITLAFESAPEVLSLSKSIEAQEIQLGERRRRWFLPSFFAGLDWAYHIDRDPALEGVDRSIPTFQLGASYPVFQGAARSFEVSRTSDELQRLFEIDRLTRDLVERRTRTAVSRMESSFPSIRFAQDAAENARRNFELVQDKYAQGLVNVTDLLEAQTVSFAADQNAVAATYVFLIDLLPFQRSISWFEYEHTQEERDALLRRIQDAIQQ